MSWQEVRGHERWVEFFTNVVQRGRLAHAYLLVGPAGVGKKLFATELAKFLLCEEPVPESWRAGFSGIYSKMLETLGRRGLKEIGRTGEKFDVNQEEPVAVVPVDKEELDDTVTEVLQKGYSVNGRVIRPAKVIIGQYNK